MCAGVGLISSTRLFCIYSRRSRSKTRRSEEDEEILLDHEMGPEVSINYPRMTKKLTSPTTNADKNATFTFDLPCTLSSLQGHVYTRVKKKKPKTKKSSRSATDMEEQLSGESSRPHVVNSR